MHRHTTHLPATTEIDGESVTAELSDTASTNCPEITVTRDSYVARARLEDNNTIALSPVCDIDGRPHPDSDTLREKIIPWLDSLTSE